MKKINKQTKNQQFLKIVYIFRSREKFVVWMHIKQYGSETAGEPFITLCTNLKRGNDRLSKSHE